MTRVIKPDWDETVVPSLTGYEGSDQALKGTGSPEGTVAADVGAIYLQSDATRGRGWWRKDSGTSVTGWVNVVAPRAGEVYNVMDYGAVGNGVTNDTAAIQAAIDAVPDNGGIVQLGYAHRFSQLDLSAKDGVWLRGWGINGTHLISTNRTTTAIILCGGSGGISGRHNTVSDFRLDRDDAAGAPPTYASGNHGIGNVNGIPFGAEISRVEIRGFGDAGIYLEGPSGPVLLMRVYVFYCDMGLRLAQVASEGIGDLAFHGGHIGSCRGGIEYAGQGQGFHLLNVDCELGTAATKPALSIADTGAGVTVYGGSWSADSAIPDALIEMSGHSAVFSGMYTIAQGGMDNFYLVDGTSNMIIGGGHYNEASGGYFCTVGAGCLRSVIIPGIVDPTAFDSGKDCVNDANYLTNGTTIINGKLNGGSTYDTVLPVKMLAVGGIGVGNSASATTPGSVTKKIEVFDGAGASLGYLAVYDAIS